MGWASSVRMLTSTAVFVVAKVGTETTSTCNTRTRAFSVRMMASTGCSERAAARK